MPQSALCTHTNTDTLTQTVGVYLMFHQLSILRLERLYTVCVLCFPLQLHTLDIFSNVFLPLVRCAVNFVSPFIVRPQLFLCIPQVRLFHYERAQMSFM